MARNDTREKIIIKGAELIYAQGFNATGLQQILQAAGIPKGSFYFYFKNKEDFGAAIIDYFKMPPMKRLEKLFEYFESVFQKSGYTLGCPIGNLSLELADTNERLRIKLESVIEELIAQIESCLKEARRDKSIPAGLNTADTAHFIFHGFEGAVLNMKVAKSVEPFRVFRNCMFGYLDNIK